MKTFSKVLQPVAAAAVLLLVVVAPTFLFKQPTTSVLVGIDCSGSADMVRVDRYLGYLDAVVGALPRPCRTHLFRFAHEVRELYNAAPRRPSDLWPIQDKELRPVAEKKGTRADLMLERAALELARASEQRLGLVLIWDGENTGARLQSAIEQLAKESRLQVVLVLGATPLHRTRVRDELSPQLGGRLVVSGNEDVANGIREFKSLLKQTKGESHAR